MRPLVFHTGTGGNCFTFSSEGISTEYHATHGRPLRLLHKQYRRLPTTQQLRNVSAHGAGC
jgi:hypothetical protein